jgi:hypothetical protein
VCPLEDVIAEVDIVVTATGNKNILMVAESEYKETIAPNHCRSAMLHVVHSRKRKE